MEYPRLRKHLIVVPLSDSITIGSTDNTGIEIEDNDGAVKLILSLCDGTNQINSICKTVNERYPEISADEVKSVIDQISEIPFIIEDAINDISVEDSERHSRNLNFLSNLSPKGHEKFEYLSRIVNSRVLVLGLGGAGSNIVYNLASFGVKTIVGVDYDTVELSNLNRQVLYREFDLGKRKVDAAKASIHSFNSNINFIGVDRQIDSAASIEELVTLYDCNYVFCCADKPSLWILKWCDEACHKIGIPWSYSGMAEYISRFRTIIPGKTSCYECLEQTILASDAAEKYVRILEDKHAAENDCILANSSILASMLMFDFVKIVGQIDHGRVASLNRVVNIDHITNEISYDHVYFSSNCYYCSKYGLV